MDRIQRLRARRTDSADPMVNFALANEVYDRMGESSSAVKYAIGAMQPIDPTYTKNTYKEGDRVLNQLDKNFDSYGIACEYDYQGSVTNDTHIKARSDIDLLTIHKAFETLEQPQIPTNPYQGDVLADLTTLRHACINILTTKFPEATVDTEGSKSISIEGGSLRRKIDVVPSNWWNTNAYAASNQKRDRGIHVLDAYRRVRLPNLPFLHNDRLQNKDQQTLGGFRKAVRLLKSLKYDSDRGVSLSSYDIAAIVYSMDDHKLIVSRGMELLLLERCNQHLDYLEANQWHRESLHVPNGTRKIFCSDGASLTGLNEIRREVKQLQQEIERDLTRSFRKLAEARIEY